MEMFEIVHPDTNEVTGTILPRAEAIATGAWCRSTNVFVINSKGEVLCHQRSLEKERMPGVWSTHLGGHVGKGETYESNAQKEAEEEAGLSVKPEHLVSWRTTRIDSARLWVREFVTVSDKAAHEFVPQPGEVERFEWLSVDEILARKQQEPAMWCAGTHDFKTEYQCLRSVIAAVQAAGAIEVAADMHVWHPVNA